MCAVFVLLRFNRILQWIGYFFNSNIQWAISRATIDKLIILFSILHKWSSNNIPFYFSVNFELDRASTAAAATTAVQDDCHPGAPTSNNHYAGIPAATATIQSAGKRARHAAGLQVFRPKLESEHQVHITGTAATAARPPPELHTPRPIQSRHFTLSSHCKFPNVVVRLLFCFCFYRYVETWSLCFISVSW